MDRRYLRPGWLLGHALVVVAVLTCLRLGWWQWDRSHEASGTPQNLGYAVLWPAFGGAFIYMWIRFIMLEKTRADEDDADLHDLLDMPVQESPPTVADPDQGIAVGIVGDEDIDDPQLIAYNRALAALAEEDRRRAE